MHQWTKFALLALGCGALWSCERRLETREDAESAHSAAVEASEGVEVSCGSLEPLLALLPSAHTVGGMAEAYRRCDPSGFSVAVGYGQGEERFSGYEFAVKVLDGNTPHAKDAPALLQQLIASTGEMFRSQLVICQEYVRNPLLTDGRNPIIANVNGVEVYIRDELEPNREIWNALAVSGSLGFHLTLRGSRARAIKTAEAARAHLLPVFAQFEVRGDP